MSIQALREFINRQSAAASSLAALAATLDSRVSDAPIDPALAGRLAELLAACGAPADLFDDLTEQQARSVVAELRVFFAIDTRLLHAGTRTVGWTHTDRTVLQSAGDTSAGFVAPLAQSIVPALPGLQARLDAPGARFLDVGTGVASLAIAFARRWPTASITGVDVWQPSLELARANVAAAGLADRIELRDQGVEHVPDENAFDLVWLPTMFVPVRAVDAGCPRLFRAAKPGGWILVNAMIGAGGDPANAAVWRLRTTMFGNADIAAPDMETRLRAAGFVDVRTLPTPPGAFATLVAGRKPE